MVVGEKAVGAMQAYLRLKRYILPSGIAREALQAALPFIAPPTAARELTLEALRSAEQFIENGFEFGFIRKPDEGDNALETLPKIKAAIRDLQSNAADARPLALEEGFRKGLEAACDVIDAHNEYDRRMCCDGRECGCYGATVHQSMQHYIRALSSPDHADAVRERAWYFSAGDTVPEWLEKIEKGNCTLTFGVDVVVTSKDGGYEVRPQGIDDNAGPILYVVSHGNVTPEIKGGGNGVAIIGYNRPYDETAEGKIERLKRLLEMVRPYVECYDTREYNNEQDAVLTEIDKALSVVMGESHADAGKVEGDGWRPIESAPKDGTIVLLGWNDPDIEEIGAVAGWYESGPNDKCWYDQYHEPVTATHWMPLRPFPAAPASEGAE
ncbi:hypothetical protein [Brucella intermedia]|uniref:hypothetical protein n=1 Tax=Brucella intermedia TaxID=94625 RepID=UPI00165D259E|nr:hypothetical protein [Brucella intermedia]QNQ43009.1 hypothetical protein IAR37_16285 [Brucella intermedia]